MHLIERILHNFEQHSNEIALVFKDTSITYAQLKTEVQNRAAYLQHKNILNQFIGIKNEDPIEHIYSILAVVISGNYYLSITPENDFLLSIEEIVLPELWIVDTYNELNAINEIAIKVIKENNLPFTPLNYPLNNFLCAFYTSGSTGSPKLVIHTLETISADTNRQVVTGNIELGDCFDFIFSFSFSASLACIFTAFSSGAKLAVYPIKQLGLGALPNFWKKENVTHASISVSTFRALTKLKFPYKSLGSLKVLCISGEAHLEKDVNLCFELFPSTCQMEVAYATTETRTIARQLINIENRQGLPVCSLGKPVADKLVSIRDENGKVLEPNSSGEIYVSSKYITNQYFSNKAETENVFGTEHGLILYKTGDFGYFNEDGYLFYQGRVHQEEKLNGAKINFFILEKVVEALPGVDNAFACICLFDQIPKLLLAYTGNSAFSSKEIYNCIAANLPLNYIPSKAVYLPKFPVTHSGKPDKAAIRAILINQFNDLSPLDLQNSPDTNNLFETLKGIFSKALNIPISRIHKHHHFSIDLGGDSMAALIFLSLIEAKFKVGISLNEFLEAGTLQNICLLIDERLEVKETAFFKIKKISGQPYFKQAILFISVFEDNSRQVYYNSWLKDKYQIFELNINLFHSDFNYKYAIQSIAAQAEKLKIDCLFGYSFSGFIAYSIASITPSIKQVIMLDTYYYFRSEPILNRTKRVKTLIYKTVRNNDPAFPIFYASNWIKNFLNHTLGIKIIKGTRPSEATLLYYQKINGALLHIKPLPTQANCIYFLAGRSLISPQYQEGGWKPLFDGGMQIFTLNAFHGELGSNRNQLKIINSMKKLLK
jgi:acyl-coenzyme A synthetase/AMP-(fatty) acid ligase/acyl carrier protein